MTAKDLRQAEKLHRGDCHRGPRPPPLGSPAWHQDVGSES